MARALTKTDRSGKPYTRPGERQVVIHEEAVAELLLKDLQIPTAPQPNA